MRRWIRGSMLFFACAALHAQQVDKDIARLVPDNMRFLSRLNADLTGDGVEDTIIVAADDRDFSATVTVFMRPHGRSLTDKRQTSDLQGIDALKLELSPLGPPTVKVAKGILIVEHLVGGANVRTAATYRYRFDGEEGRMRQIGLDAKRTSSTLTVQLSWNALNGARIFKKGNEPESRTTYKQGTVWMDLTRSADDMIDQALGDASKGQK